MISPLMTSGLMVLFPFPVKIDSLRMFGSFREDRYIRGTDALRGKARTYSSLMEKIENILNLEHFKKSISDRDCGISVR
jgi:hypothetical protein